MFSSIHVIFGMDGMASQAVPCTPFPHNHCLVELMLTVPHCSLLAHVGTQGGLDYHGSSNF